MSDPRRRVLNWLSWFVVLSLGLALPSICERAPDVVETVYARGLFPWIARGLAPIGRLVPFSVAQLIVAGAIVVVLLEIVRLVRALRTGDGEDRKPLDPRGDPKARVTADLETGTDPAPHTGTDPDVDTGRSPPPQPGVAFPRHHATEVLQRGALRWLRVVTVVVWLFHLVWGLNYARPSLRERMNLPAVPPTTERLARLTRTLVHETNHAYKQAIRFDEMTADTVLGTQLRLEEQDLWRALAVGYDVVEPRMKGISFSAPKLPVPAGAILSRLGISGIYFPFTGEASVNRRMPPLAYPFVAAHEMAHQRGIAREDEANALAYLACRQAGFWVTRYSGALSAYRRSLSALFRAEPDSARQVAQLLAPGPRRDQEVIREFWMSQEGIASEAADRVNDTYLKANAQEDGVASYGRMVDLLIVLHELDMLRN